MSKVFNLLAATLLAASSVSAQSFTTGSNVDGAGFDNDWRICVTRLTPDNVTSFTTNPAVSNTACNLTGVGVTAKAARVTAAPQGWKPTPFNGAYYIAAEADASLYEGLRDEQANFQYTYYRTFTSAAAFSSLWLKDFRFDNTFLGWSVNGSALSTLGLSPNVNNPPPFGTNWLIDYELSINGAAGIVGTNTLAIRIGGNGTTDAMLANTSVVPEPSTYALMAAGLAGIFAVSRRRRTA